MVEVRKKEKENTQNLIRRFTKAVQQSGILLQARKIRFKKREKSDKARRDSALRRERKKKEYERLKKLGRLEE